MFANITINVGNNNNGVDHSGIRGKQRKNKRKNKRKKNKHN